MRVVLRSNTFDSDVKFAPSNIKTCGLISDIACRTSAVSKFAIVDLICTLHTTLNPLYIIHSASTQSSNQASARDFVTPKCYCHGGAFCPEDESKTRPCMRCGYPFSSSPGIITDAELGCERYDGIVHPTARLEGRSREQENQRCGCSAISQAHEQNSSEYPVTLWNRCPTSRHVLQEWCKWKDTTTNLLQNR